VLDSGRTESRGAQMTVQTRASEVDEQSAGNHISGLHDGVALGGFAHPAQLPRVQNAPAWSNFGSSFRAPQAVVAKPSSPADDALWKEAQAKEEEKKAHERKMAEHEARMRESREREVADLARMAEEAKLQKVRDEVAARGRAEEEETALKARLEEERRAKLRELQGMTGTVNEQEKQREMMKRL